MSKWYGLDGDLVNDQHGSSNVYVPMERKPENGCEIQTCCDGVSRIMLSLGSQVSQGKSAEQEEDTDASLG